MPKKWFNIISRFLMGGTLVSFLIWVFMAQDNGTIYYEGNENVINTFLILFILALIAGSIGLNTMDDKSDTISKKKVFSGIAIAIVFLLWRLSVTF